MRARIGKIKPSRLMVKVRSAIAKSEFPGGLTQMRSIAAIRQEYYRYKINFYVQVAFYCRAVLIIKGLWKEWNRIELFIYLFYTMPFSNM